MTIEQIQAFCKERKIGWSMHTAETMMMKCGISKVDVLNCLQGGEILKQACA